MNPLNSYSDAFDAEGERASRYERARSRAIADLMADDTRLGEAVADYWTGMRLRCDGPDTLTEWTLALVAAEAALTAICWGDEIPDKALPAFRALLMHVETAKRVQADAVEDAVP